MVARVQRGHLLHVRFNLRIRADLKFLKWSIKENFSRVQHDNARGEPPQ
jgi:hypothetical protein